MVNTIGPRLLMVQLLGFMILKEIEFLRQEQMRLRHY